MIPDTRPRESFPILPVVVEQLGGAQDHIREAAIRVGEVANRFAGDHNLGTQRMECLAQAISLLNQSWSLVRQAVNHSQTNAENPVRPARTEDRGPVTRRREKPRGRVTARQS